MSEKQKALERARQRYEMDYKGIVLNTLVSATSSVTAAGLLNFVQSVPQSQLPIIVGVIFVAQILPKLLVELNRNYRVNKAKREGYSEGLLEDDFGGDKSVKATALDHFLSMCEHASYF